LKIITLLSDFGLRDTYVAEMKGAILGLAPEARLIDLTHEIPAQDVAAGAHWLRRAVQAFPAGTIHLAVVDPGVGSARRPLLIASGASFLVGPDNGLLLEAASLLGEEPRAFALQNPAYQRAPLSDVFHGRDLFAPAAAHLSLGVPAESFGPAIDDPIWLPRPSLHTTPDSVSGEVLLSDHFGNLITSIPQEAISGSLREDAEVLVGGVLLGRLLRSYSEASSGGLLALIGSGGFLEIAVCNGSAAARLPGASRGSQVVLRRVKR
jgi:S-adenosyl-L-methionine hydrolase (adenosine-forming)